MATKNDDILDLNKQNVEEISGKILELAYAQYILLDMLAEGGEKYVYPIKNKRSGLILYLAKIYKCRPGSPEAEEALNSLPWKIFDLVIPKLVLYTEIYEVAGAIIELQPYGVDHNLEFNKRLMDRAGALLGSERWAEAVEVLDDILHQNPSHSMAMLNKAVAIANLGEVWSAIQLVEQAIDVEPNFPDGYHLLSSILLRVVGPKAAIAALKRTLSRYPCDPVTCELLLRIAVDYDVVEVSRETLDEVYRLGSRPSGEHPREFVHFEKEIEDSARRLKQYSKYLTQALDAQMKASWTVALEFCRRAIDCSKNNQLARINAFACQYHLGLAETIAEELVGMLHRWDGVALAAATSLGVLCADLAKMPMEAKRIALWIARKFDNYVDIPGIPVGVTDGGALLESRSSQPIIDALRRLENNCSGGEATEIAHLRSLYEKREREFA